MIGHFSFEQQNYSMHFHLEVSLLRRVTGNVPLRQTDVHLEYHEYSCTSLQREVILVYLFEQFSSDLASNFNPEVHRMRWTNDPRITVGTR